MKYLKIEEIHHSKEDQEQFKMDNEATVIITIPEMRFVVNCNENEFKEAKEKLIKNVQEFIIEIAQESKGL